MPRLQFLIALLCAGFVAHASAREYFVLLGGGAGPASSEVSIEKNVQWISGLLDKLGYSDHDVLFAAGRDNPVADVKTNRRNPNLAEVWLPVSRVFGNRNRLFEAYHKNTVARSPDSSSRENALALLRDRLQAMQAGDSLMLIYNGHGGSSEQGPSRHHLRLWNGSKLSVSDFVQALGQQPPQTTFRYILPQCYSGPFLMTIHQQLSIGEKGPINTARCGFTAAPHHRKSEGCTVVEDEREYRDYSTYFFAALDGRSRLGQALETDPDINGDGAVGLSEAHYYAAIQSYSRDVPGTTSEYFLQQWQPWYVRGHTYDVPEGSGEDHYAGMARTVAAQLGFPLDVDHVALNRQVSAGRSELESQIDSIENVVDAQREREKRLRRDLSQASIARWPELRNPYGTSFHGLTREHIGEIGRWLSAQELYLELESLQNEMDSNEEKTLELERDLGMHLRILRWLELSRLEHHLYQFGSEPDISNYESLQDCESWTGLGA